MNRSGKLYGIVMGVLLAVVVVLLVLLINSLNKGPIVLEKEPTLSAQEPTTTPTEPTTTPTDPTTTPTDPSRKPLSVDHTEEAGDVVVVTTSYCQLKLPYAFADMIKVEAINDDVMGSATLLFTAQINGREFNIYALTFGGEGDTLAGAMTLEEGMDPVLVYVTIYGQQSGLSEGERQAFIAAQETFNDVMTSLQEGENFVPAI